MSFNRLPPPKSGSASRVASGGTAAKVDTSKKAVGTDTKPTSVATAARYSAPSAKLAAKTINPFEPTAKNKSGFATVYLSGGFPCRFQSGSVRHSISWSEPLEKLSYDPILVMFAEGLVEVDHPLPFVAKLGFKELLGASGAIEKVIPLIERLTPPLRNALTSMKDPIYFAGLDAVAQLSATVGPAFNAQLKFLIAQIAKRANAKDYKDQITAVLHILEENGGQECLKLIKSKIPTYN